MKGDLPMSVQLEKENVISTYPVRAVPQQMEIEAEVTLPGGLRDEVRILYADAVATPQACEGNGGRVTVSGTVDFHVLYAQGDLTRVKAAEARGDFSRTLTAAAPDGARFMPLCEVNRVSHRVFNGRVLLQADVNVYAEALATQEAITVTRVLEVDAQTLDKKMLLQQVVGEGGARELVRGEFDVNEALQAREALFSQAEARVEDIIGGADGRATVTGTIDLTACFASALPGRPVVCSQHSFPFEKAVTLSGEMGEMLAAVATVTDTAVALEGDDKGKILRAEVEIDVKMQSIGERQANVITDVFFTGDSDVQTQEGELSFCTDMISEQTAESARVQLLLPENAPRIKTVLCAFARPVLAGASEQNGKMTVDMALHTTLLYMTEDSGIPLSYTTDMPLRMTFSCAAQEEDMLSLTASHVEASVVAGDRAELRCVVTLHASGARFEKTQVVSHVERNEKTAPVHVLALYITQPEERLWDVMKRYRLSEKAIKALNEQASGYAVDAPLPLSTRLIAYRR